MGAFASCCKPSASDVMTPDVETRRRQQVEAAERRRQQEEARGVKDPQRLQRQQLKAADTERKAEELNREGGATLRWQAH
ncbi:small VCP/p97-interacting protein [Hyposmocoma kahamanoa]|uniref:small VCP/p97-interacting protein n=1 Tax=Hyposmocoma kahamanoa TaxID=1477025 RepID=UPI000E6DA0C5|nr:small VCP/p97-interacting protein [Hyposmocoma kahamanoa]XP_026325433.1 small VCP/p97-interacting protein [Hyposmocoma kahamanoa]XP_026325434.1 small VCP/p97-interacting protein [Hyposmocoma kahamanoa]